MEPHRRDELRTLGQQDLRAASFGHAEHIDRSHDARFDCLDGIVLIVTGSRGTGQVVDLIHLEQDRGHDGYHDHRNLDEIEEEPKQEYDRHHHHELSS